MTSYQGAGLSSQENGGTLRAPAVGSEAEGWVFWEEQL